MFLTSVLSKRLLFFALFPLTIALSVSAAPLVPLSAVSRQHHNNVGDLDIPLPLAGPPGVECREVNGNCDIVLTFADAVTFTGAGVTTGTATVSQCENNGTEVIIHLTGVANAQRITVYLSHVTDGVTTNNISIPMGVLFGDTTGDGRVNSSDVSYVQFESGHLVTQDNCRPDVTRNGSINSSDVSAVQFQSGTAVGWTPPSLDRLSTGHDSASLALEPDGSIWSWGQRPGDGGSQPRSYPLALGSVQDPISASAGDGHVSVLAKNGVVWSWGQNQEGQLGDGTIYDTNSPKAILSNVIAIKAGGFHTIALFQNGTVTSWGKNNYGQLGNGDTTSSVLPVEVNTLTAVMQIATGYERSVALKSNGTVWAWGFVRENQGQPPTFDSTPVQVSGLTAVTAIAAGRSHATAVKSDGTVWAWGSNELGQLGNASVSGYSASPVQVSNISNAVNVASSYDHTLALRADGTVWAWGANDVGQLGNGTTNPTNIAVEVNGLTNVVAIAAARSYSMAMKADGSVWAWGEDTLFLGIVPGGNVLVPQQAILNPLDGNGNIMDDRWEIQYFGNLKQSGEDDFDGDGIPNSVEYQIGTPPNDGYNGQIPHPIFRSRTRAAIKVKHGFPPFVVSGPQQFFLRQVDTSSIEGGNPESQVGGTITTTIDPDTGAPSEQQEGNPFDLNFHLWPVTEDRTATRFTETEHTENAYEFGGGAYDDPPNEVTDLAATLIDDRVLDNEYTTEMMINRALAALPPIPAMDDPIVPADDALFAQLTLFANDTRVYASHSNYQFKWYASPNLPAQKQVTWLETFAPANGGPTTTTVRHWEGTANETPVYHLSTSVPGHCGVFLPGAEFKARDGKINAGFDPRVGNNADGTPGGESWTSVVKGSPGSPRNVVKLAIPSAAQLIKLVFIRDPGQPEPENVVEVSQMEGFVNGDNNPLTLTGRPGDDAITTTTIEAHVFDDAGHDTGQVCARLRVMALPPRTVSLGIFRVADGDPPSTGDPPGVPTDGEILTRLNEIYAQAGITFRLDDARSLSKVPFDQFEIEGVVSFHDGLVQPEEFPTIAKAIADTTARLHLVLANNSGDSLNDDDQAPYVRGDTDPDLGMSIVFTLDSGAVADLIASHELGHLLGLSDVAPGNPHDPGPFPTQTLSTAGGLMHAGNGTDQPGLWLAQQDWRKANDNARNFQ